MGIYGQIAHKVMEDQSDTNLKNHDITVEVYVDHDLYTKLLSEPEFLNENMVARVDLSENNKKGITVLIRDNETMTYSNTKGNHGPSVKIVKPEAVVGRGVDIIIPAFQKTGEAPYKGAKVSGKFSGSSKATVDPNALGKIKMKGDKLPDEINLGVKFVNDFHKELYLIFTKPENETNQYELLKDIIKKCDYVTKVTVSGDKEVDAKYKDLINKKGNNK